MAATTLEKLQVIIEAQTSGYKKAMNDVQSQTKQATAQIEAQTNRMGNAFKTIGKIAIAAFSVRALVNFGKSAVQLASDLEEVQNVVDVTFGSLSTTIDDFAQKAVEQFGLSETSAKKYASTMGAMFKSMGLSTDAAAEMSMEITGLSADMASFYNLDTDEAFAKIRSGISGETEPLKQLGINMSVANLQAYAMSQGITKAYSSMSQSEQAMLRYNYLLSVTKDAQGDFARTSDGWANQLRVLSERWNQLKAAIGTGLIAALTPVIQVLNNLLSKILSVTDAFSNFIAKLTGKGTRTQTTVADTGAAAVGATDSLESASSAADDLTSSTGKAGSAAKKAAKEYAGLGSFDEIHTLNKGSDSGSGGSGGSGGGGGAGGVTGGALQESIVDAASEIDGSLNPFLDKMIDKLLELKDLFMNGFRSGLGDVSFQPILDSLGRIRDNLAEIFTSPEVLASANGFVNQLATTIGQVAGSVTSVGITIGSNLIGGFDLFLEQNKERVKQSIVDILDVATETQQIIGDFAESFALIFSAFGGANGQQVTADIMTFIAIPLMQAAELVQKLRRDLLDIFTRPFIDNAEKLRQALDDTLGVVSEYTGIAVDNVTYFSDKVGDLYDNSISPMLDSVATGLSDIVSNLTDFWTGDALPIFSEMAEALDAFFEEHVQPLIDKVAEVLSSVANALTEVWENVLVPFFNWLIDKIWPILLPIIQTIWNVVLTVAGTIMDVLAGIMEVLRGIIDFLTGIFTGDWELAWEGIKSIFTGVWDAMWASVTLVLETITGAISIAWETVKGIFETVWAIIVAKFTFVWETIKNVVISVVGIINNFISNGFSIIKGIFETVWGTISSFFTNVWEKMKSAVTNTMTTIKTGISSALNGIKTIWTTVWTTMKLTVTLIFNSIWRAIKGVINYILGGIEGMANGVISGINTVIGALNNLSFDIPDWVPEYGGKSFGFDIKKLSKVSLPRLEVGGIVDSATIAMIGENGKEAVVPLENHTEWMDALGIKLGEIISRNIVGVLETNSDNQGENVVVTKVQIDGKTLVEQVDKHRARQGYRFSTVH